MILTHGYHSTTNDYAGEIGRVLREKHGLSPPETLVVLPEGLPNEQMPSLYRAADVFVLPSRGEGWGRPHVEAMACGIPIIATNCTWAWLQMDAIDKRLQKGRDRPRS